MDALDNVSEDQARVLDFVEQGYNVTVKANPGSGKTRLILQMASAFPDKNMLILSFNTALVKETKDKLNQLCIADRAGWTAVHTYHGLLGTITSETVFDDLIFGELLRQVDFHEIEDWTYKDVELLVIDEAQDLKERFVLMVLILIIALATNKSALQMVLLFDENQTLYYFYPINKADARFALLAEHVFGTYLEKKQWANVVLPVTYRLTPQNVTFLNAVMPSLQLVSGHTETKLHNYITLFIADVYRDAAQIVLDIVHREAGMAQNYGKIAILVSSVRSSRSPARAVVDVLAANGIPIHVSRGIKTSCNDEKTCVNDVRKNKIQVVTDHNSKGQEFDVTIKINDSFFFDGHTIVNPALVANTRARQRSYLIQHVRKVTQQQIDDLLSHPSITQRILRVIVKREVPIELTTKQSQKLQVMEQRAQVGNDGEPELQHAISCENLYTFLDVEYMENLMEHVIVESIGSDQFEDGEENKTSSEKEEKEAEDDESRFMDESAVNDYIHANVIVVDNDDGTKSNTFVDVMRIVNQTLALALEFFFSRRLTQRATQIDDRTRFATGVHNLAMHDRLQDPLYHITGLYCDDKEAFFQNCQNALQHFAAVAVVIDAYDNYRDLLYILDNRYTFATTEDVKLRFATLRCIVESLIHGHAQLTGNDDLQLVWNKQQIGHFMRNELPLELTCHVPLHSADKSFFIFYSYDAEISNEDRLRALAATYTCKPQVDEPTIFLVSLVALTVEKLSLANEQKTTLFDSSQTTSKQLIRHTPCEFLKHSLECKFWSVDADANSENDDQVESRKRKTREDDEFIANIHTKIKKYLNEKKERIE